MPGEVRTGAQGAELSDAQCVLVCASDLGEAALKIIGVTTEDDGIYTCIAVNDMGSASSSASLRVLGKHLSYGTHLPGVSKAKWAPHLSQPGT